MYASHLTNVNTRGYSDPTETENTQKDMSDYSQYESDVTSKVADIRGIDYNEAFSIVELKGFMVTEGYSSKQSITETANKVADTHGVKQETTSEMMDRLKAAHGK